MSLETNIIRYTKWVINHPWTVIGISLLLVGAAASGAKNLSFTTSYRVFFGADNPQRVAFENLEATYTKNDNVMFIVTPKEDSVFTETTLKAIQELTTEAWQVPYSIRVDSISNFQHTQADQDDLMVQDLIPEDVSFDTKSINFIKSVALKEPLLVGRIISKSGHVSGVNVTIHLPGNNQTKEVPEVVVMARDLAKKIESKYPNITIRLTGMIMMNNAFSESSKADMKSLVLISFVLMLVTLAALTRGFAGMIGTFIIIIFSIITAMGIGGHLGFPITPPSATTPNIVLTVAIANAVHILVTFLQSMRAGMEKQAALIESMRINMQPVFLASITTAIGFLSMNFSDVPPFQHLGNMVSIGVVASFIFSVFFLPAFLSLVPIKAKASKDQFDFVIMAKLGNFVVEKRRQLMWGMLVIIVSLVAFLPKNELNDIFVHYFDESTTFRQNADYFTENLGGLYLLDYSLQSDGPGGISDPGYLADVEKFAHWYRQQPETKHVNSITDIMKRLNKNMHADDEQWYTQPTERDLAAQYLLLYEMSLPYGLDLNNQINIDKSATRFTATLKTMSSNELIALEQRANTWLENNATHIFNSKGTGTSLMFAYIGKVNIKSMIYGTTGALIMISIILIFALRSFKIGLVSMVPNLVPAAMGFGLWGLLVGEIGLSLSIVAGMTLGIVVDDTVHFLSKYLRARREKQLDSHDAVRYAFTSVGAALTITSIVLIIGFSILALSSFRLNSGMGTMTAIVIAFALLADFLFLPPLLMKLEKQFTKA